MNTFKKLTLAVLILGTGAQTINAHPWTTKAITAATLAGLSLGTAVAIKYYGFNTAINVVLEKYANAKNWFSNKLSDSVYGSHMKQLQKERNGQIDFPKIDFDKMMRNMRRSQLVLGSQRVEEEETSKLKDLFQRAYNAYKSQRLNYVRDSFRTEAALYLENGADPDGFMTYGEIQILFLFAAVRMGDLKLTELLLQAGADPDLPNSAGNVPLMEALVKLSEHPTVEGWKTFFDIYVLFSKYGANFDSINIEFFCSVVENRDFNPALRDGVEGVQLLIENEIPKIVFHQNEKKVRILINAGADVNMKGYKGYTPLMNAVHKNDKELAQILLAAGADIDTVSQDGYTALTLAVHNHSFGILNVLLENGANPNLPNTNFNAKIVAQELGNQAIINLLNKFQLKKAL